MVLPATPYIFPQRPLLFPTLPPAIVLVDSNLQPINKPPISFVNRNSGDITKTTMVNILPISAYSHPLSASKNKKNNMKSKTDTNKKTAKKLKPAVKHIKSPVVPVNITQDEHKETTNDSENVSKNTYKQLQKNTSINNVPKNDVTVEKSDSDNIKTVADDKDVAKQSKTYLDSKIKTKTKEDVKLSKVIEPPKCSEPENVNKVITVPTTTVTTLETVINNIQNNVDNNSRLNKVPLVEDKDKENKLPNILDSTLCDNVVDAGNARLELAEEFLAASPTAAFLMSFPLVSGNRADSPAEEHQSSGPANLKDSNQRRNETVTQSVDFYDKSNTSEIKPKSVTKAPSNSNIVNKQNDSKFVGPSVNNKQSGIKSTTTGTVNVTNENPFLNLPMPSLISSSCTISDPTFGLDFDCNISKSIPSQCTNYVTSNNIFYKSDPFSSVKNTIYSTSTISSGHEFNSLGLYPCAMEKYTPKNKTDYGTVEDNLMKIGSSRLTYDIDLGWSHKSFDFVGCTTTSNTFNKDNILTNVSAPYSNSYNPFNPEFHVPLVSTSNKKDSVPNKPSSSFSDTITSFYSQPTNLWTEDVPFYTNNNFSKTLNTKHSNYLQLDHTSSINQKSNNKHYDTKQVSEAVVETNSKTNLGLVQMPEKYTKKSPSKMHINWMTSEIRPMQNHCTPSHIDGKESHKPPYGLLENVAKKQEQNESNYFPISMHNFPTQGNLEELQVWPSTRAVGPTEISIEPPPINLPTLIGDLALGPHDKKKNSELPNRGVQPQSDLQNCGNFLSVTQLMNRSSDNMTSRYQTPNIMDPKSMSNKQTTHFPNDGHRKAMNVRLESQPTQPCYVFNDSKMINSYENIGQFPQNKPKTNKSDKSSKSQKNNYSAEALIRGGTCTQKVQDNSSMKFMMPTQKYGNFNTPQDNTIAQVSHFPPILDYSDNSYTSQQFSGTTLYNTTNTISNSFYSNFMPGGTNLMSGNYAGGPFPGDFMDYNQTPECNYTNHKYEELKMRNSSTVFQHDKVPSNYKSSRRESAAKHKLECSKKESNKKYQSKRTKLNAEVEEWNDQSHLLWQNKPPNKRHGNLMSEDLTFPNYVGNQIPGQYQPDFFNSHLMSSNVQSVGHNVDRSLSSFPVTSRANFNLSTIFPEITMVSCHDMCF